MMQTKIAKIYKFSKVLFIFFTILSIGNFSFAVEKLTIPGQITDLEEQIDATLVPEFPTPGDEVTITLSAFGTDLNNATITWYVDGKNAKQGKGERVFKIKAGKQGQNINIKVTIDTLNGPTVTKNFTINPQTVDIVWEAGSYTPPFYKGKALFTPMGKVTFVAMPNITGSNGGLVDSRTITYKWGQNNEILGSLSGYGQNVLTYTGNILARPVETTIEAKTADGIAAQNYLTLATTFPETNIYEDSPLYGTLFNNEVSGTFSLQNNEEKTIAAYPFYINAGSRLNSEIAYGWKINYTDIDVPTGQNKMTFRNTENLEGKSLVNVSTILGTNFLQKSNTDTMIEFKKPSKVFSF